MKDIFKHGTLSIGYIGLSETMEILTHQKYHESDFSYQKALSFVQIMRNYIDYLRNSYSLNFSLLATSGEYICGRFPALDSIIYPHAINQKEFYTNSFHVNVDSGLNLLDKIKLEGPFHSLSNGGSITYVELASAPLNNIEGIMEIIEFAINNGVSYFGFNFPLDICNDCENSGIFDICNNCGSSNILKIRRVSGYLEIFDYFTNGKKAEVPKRKENGG